MSAKKDYDSDEILHVRIPAGLKDQLKRIAAGSGCTLGALVTKRLIAGEKSATDWATAARDTGYRSTITLLEAQLSYLSLLVTSHKKRMHDMGKEPDPRLTKDMESFKKSKARIAKRRAASLASRRRKVAAEGNQHQRPLTQVFPPLVPAAQLPERVYDLSVHDWRWLSLTEAVSKMPRGQLGEFAAKVGISPSMLSRYRSPRTARGHRRISSPVAQRMAYVLQIEPAVFDKWDQKKATSLRLGKSVEELIAVLTGIAKLSRSPFSAVRRATEASGPEQTDTTHRRTRAPSQWSSPVRNRP